MAELLICVTSAARPAVKYRDGDVLLALNDRRILAVHAQGLARTYGRGFKSNGLRPDGLPRSIRERVATWRYERVSEHEVLRTHLPTGVQDVLGPTPNDHGEVTRPALKLAKKLQSDKHAVFGETGREVWYGGPYRWDAVQTASAWDAIESRSALRRGHPRFASLAWADKELCKHLALRVPDMDDELARRLTAPEIDFDDRQPEFDFENGVGKNTVQRRRLNLRWRDFAPVAVADALNPGKRIDPVDVRALMTPAVVDARPRINRWSVTDHLTPDASAIGSWLRG